VGKYFISKKGTKIPDHRGNKCYVCKKNTRNIDRIYCKKCRYDLHYGRRVDGYGNKLIEYEDFVNDKFYD
tara:strand:+ start:554 stop:763 length:210 start_codon:yes stop_codon:yes gene_type:complete